MQAAETKNGETPEARPLAGRHALITGGNRGIGAAIAAELAGLGANLTLAARDEESLNQTREKLMRSGDVAVSVQAVDLTDPDSVAGVVDRAAADLGPVARRTQENGSVGSTPGQNEK